MSEIADTESLDAAIYCAAALQRSGRYDGQLLGLVDPNLPDMVSMASLRKGEVVLFSACGIDTLVVEQPYSKQVIEQREKGGPRIYSHTIINVPWNFILEIMPGR